MGQKIRVICVIGILFAFWLCTFNTFESVKAGEVKSELGEVDLFLHGDPNNATLNTSFGETEEHLVLTTTPSNVPSVPIYIGEWVTEPVKYPMNIEGSVWFVLIAKGNLQQVRFSAYLTVNGVDVSGVMTTDTQNLNESTPAVYISDPVNLTQSLELNTTDNVGFRLELVHTDPTVINPISSGKNVTLLLGYDYPSNVAITTNSMRVVAIDGEDDPNTGNMMVTAQIKCSFGYEDYNYATAKSDYGTFSLSSESVVDEATMEVEWSWDYSVSEGGSYPVTVKAYDMSLNRWTLEEDVHITTPNTEIDFSLSDSDISFSNEPKKDENTTITAKITGSGKRWSSYSVDVEFYDGSSLIETITATIKRGKTNEVTVLWEPDSTGTHVISVKIDPDDSIKETKENNNEATKNVDVTEGGGGSGTPGFEPLLLFLAFIIVLFLGMRNRRVR
ncbi:MAG: hypothetical protein JSV56_08785 [Methanomassiliicoccales archaeon]|nr:MAG: hypothetical protein JSV56_08785 [Methanomassiliicoccales archaeon]